MARNFGIYFFRSAGSGVTVQRARRHGFHGVRINSGKKERENRRGIGRERGFHGSFYPERERAASCENSAYATGRKGETEGGREGRWTGSVSRGPHSYISRETKTERSLGRGRTFCRSVADAETAKRPDNPFLLSPAAFFSHLGGEPRRARGVAAALFRRVREYVRQCRETASSCRARDERKRRGEMIYAPAVADCAADPVSMGLRAKSSGRRLVSTKCRRRPRRGPGARIYLRIR